MKIYTLLFAFTLVACGKQQADQIVLPANQSSPYEQSVLSDALDKIQSDFDQLNVNVNLRSIRYSVAQLNSDLAGYCIYRADGSPVGIALNHSIFENWQIESEREYGLLFKVLLHEIGHCFFGRHHEEELFTVPGFFLRIDLYGNSRELWSHFPVSVMNDTGHLSSIPKSVWPYYVREVAGLDRVNDVTDIQRYVPVSLEAI